MKKEQTTYLMIKPGYANKLEVVYYVLYRILYAELKVVDAGYVNYSIDDAKDHYIEHDGKPFVEALKKYLSSDKVYGIEIKGKDAVNKVRVLACGDKTRDTKHKEGCLRYDILNIFYNSKVEGDPENALNNNEFKNGKFVRENVIHSSDSESAAKHEIELFKKLKNKELSNNI